MRVGNKLWTNWDKAPLRLWKTQLNFVVFCASSACGVSSEHLNYKKHAMVESPYRVHIYYHVRRVLKRLHFLCRTKLVLMLSIILTAARGSSVCEDHKVPHGAVKYRDK